MNGRTVLTIVNFIALAFAILVLYEFPKYTADAFYLFVGWMIASLVLYYQPWASRPIGSRPSPAGAGGAGAGTRAAVASPPGSPPSPPVDFCIYCGSSLPVGAETCPTCGHARAAI